MQLENIAIVKLEKDPNNKDRKRKRAPNELNWYKKNIFFELQYWSSLKLRYNLDIIYIEKNVCDNIMKTSLSIEGKIIKDTYKAREDWLQWISEGSYGYKLKVIEFISLLPLTH